MSTYSVVNARLAYCLNSVLNVKALVGAFNQEKALVGAFSVIVQPVMEPMDRFTALPGELLVTVADQTVRHMRALWVTEIADVV